MSRAGTILRVDLTGGKIEKEPTSRYVKDYIGGAGIAGRIFWDEVPPETRPFDPKNLLLFNTGPLTGTLLGNKGGVASKTPEPANNPFVYVGIGGQFPSEMKFAGYDHIVIKGKAKGPVYLFINNDSIEIKDAKHLWGLDVHETQRKIKDELKDPDVQIACIGPAGENLVVYSLILHDIQNTAAPKGLGAVMGSKNLKAVAVRGTKGLKIADPKAFLALYDEFFDEFREGGRAYAFGKQQHLEGISRQISEGYRLADEIPTEIPPSPTMEFNKKYLVGHIGCAFCPLQCHQNYSVPGVGNGGTTCVAWLGMLYEQLYVRTDYRLWWKRTMLANRYGIDHLYIELLGAWLIELYKRGIITAADTDGIPMEKGSDEAVTALIEKIARGEGFGKLLAGGVVPAAMKLGKGSIEFATQSDNSPPYGAPGMEIGEMGTVGKYRTGELEGGIGPGWSDRYANVLSFAKYLEISPRKAANIIDEYCNETSERITGDRDAWKGHFDKRRSLISIEMEDSALLRDITGHCDVTSEWLASYGMKFGCEDMAKWLNAATGTHYTTEQAREVAYRHRLMKDAYNILCARMIGEKPVPSKAFELMATHGLPGPDRVRLGHVKNPEDRKKLGENYCILRGYDSKTGIPTREALEKLGLKDVADKLAETVASPGA
jgi:aldehyde:ferredoxin oxidoreductase